MTSPVDRSNRLSAKDELHSLSADYAAAVDDRDGERLSQLFVTDGQLVLPNIPDDLGPVITRSGHEALRRVPDKLSRYDRTFHQLSNNRYVVRGDEASGEVSCVAHHLLSVPPEGAAGGTAGIDVVWYIRYRDDYQRTGAGWKFVRRELHLQWVEEHAVSAVGPPSGAT